ncbi:LacI family DNA-binding transcriptional regulator [Nocardioides bigeumensis]|jgi:LacI family transcriptional regulator|uniref:LacI family DNA-binding transcriptional regulator n=1 Tax=Nocardioides bigeumensis TaxID=433657 RepID=A0ABP5JPW4_9ACTN
MRPTIRDVASKAGVSIATVSRALRDPQIVSKETQSKVALAAQELDYVPNHLGRQLAERRHAANGIVFPDLSGPYFAEVVLGYEAVAAELGRSVLLLSTRGRESAAAMVHDLAARTDGLVVLGRTVPDDALHSLVRRGVPLVLLARTPLAEIDSLNAENRQTARALAAHLTAAGAGAITFVGDPDLSPDIAERLEGLEAGAGGATVTVTRTPELDEGSGQRAGDAVVASGRLPDAFACANDELALGLMTTLRAGGVRVPDDVLVSGWDDVMAARYAGLTTVRQPMRDLGATAARMLDELIRGQRTEPRHEVLATELIIRTSTTSTTGTTSTT